jgi:hypothetical protein
MAYQAELCFTARGCTALQWFFSVEHVELTDQVAKNDGTFTRHSDRHTPFDYASRPATPRL